MMGVNSTPLYSGVKRNRGITLLTSPTFGDVPPPLRPPSAFQKKLIFNQPSVPIKQELQEELCSPAAKLIKRESNTFNEIFIRKFSHSDSSRSNSPISSAENSPVSSASSATSTSAGRGQQVHGKNNHQSAFAPKSITPPKTFNFNNHPYSPNFANNSPILFSFKQNNNPPPFCYNCKLFGHEKFQCYRMWFAWWPIEYLNRYRWLRGKLHAANQLRRQGMMDRYMEEARKIEKQVENADRQRQNNFTQYRTGPPPQKRNNNNGRYWGPSKGRDDGQKILQAIRRVKPPTPPAGCPAQHKFDFDCHKLIEDLQRQVNQLRFALTNSKSGSASPRKVFSRPTPLKSLS